MSWPEVLDEMTSDELDVYCRDAWEDARAIADREGEDSRRARAWRQVAQEASTVRGERATAWANASAWLFGPAAEEEM
ncbi:MAG: hypothetical protein QM655_02355 [Nocardioidaceae bacterium]